MKIRTAIAKLHDLLAKDPKAEVSYRRLKPKKKKRIPKRLLSQALREWAVKRSEGGGTFTFLEACRYYDRIGGSAGTSTVRHRLEQIGARNVTPGLAESHLRAQWTLQKGVMTGPIKDMIEADPTFRDRYEAQRRQIVIRGGLAPEPFERAVFEKSYGKKGKIWVQVQDEDPDRRFRISVVPDPKHVPSTN